MKSEKQLQKKIPSIKGKKIDYDKYKIVDFPCTGSSVRALDSSPLPTLKPFVKIRNTF